MIIIYKIDSLQTDRQYGFIDETSERLSRWRQRFDSRPKYQSSSLTTYCATFCSTSEPPKLYVLEQRNVVVMSRSWPAFSLDANYFEHLLDDFQRHLNIFQPRPATTDELSSYVLLMWYDVSITFINRLIHSMKKM